MSSDICVVIPAFNAADTVGNVVQGALKYIPRVIVADDGSSDHTADVAAEAGAEVIVIGNNRGKGNALKALFQKADEEFFGCVLCMD